MEFEVGDVWTTRGGWKAVVVREGTHIVVTHLGMRPMDKIKKVSESIMNYDKGIANDYGTVTLMHWGGDGTCCKDVIDDGSEESDLIQPKLL